MSTHEHDCQHGDPVPSVAAAEHDEQVAAMKILACNGQHDWVTCGPEYLATSFYGRMEDYGRDRCQFCLSFKESPDG